MERIMGMERVFVTGGSGFVGGRLIELLRQDGIEVRALARSDDAARRVERLGAEPVRGDLADPPSFRDALRGCDGVFHVAALFKLWGSPQAFREANVDATARLLEAAGASGTVRRFVQVGAAAVVQGPPGPMRGVDETSPRQSEAWAPYSASKAEAEALILGANRPGRFETAVIRPPMIWGAGMPMLGQIAEMVQAGRFRWAGDGTQLMSTAHVDNVCHAALLACRRSEGGQVYFVTDGEDRSYRSVVTAFLRTRGVPPPGGRVPFPLAWSMARLMEAFWRTGIPKGEPPLTRQMLRLIGHDFTLNITKARRELGYEPVKSWEQGLREMTMTAGAAGAGVASDADAVPA